MRRKTEYVNFDAFLDNGSRCERTINPNVPSIWIRDEVANPYAALDLCSDCRRRITFGDEITVTLYNLGHNRERPTT